MVLRVGCVVEGQGDKAAVPALIHRIAQQVVPASQVAINPNDVLVRPKNHLMRERELTTAVELMARRVAPGGGVLVLFDADTDCPAEWGPRVLEWARARRTDIQLGVVLAKAEFESWFLAAAESLRGVRRLPPDLQPPPAPEAIQGAKEWLRRQMPQNQPYSETADQVALTREFDLQVAAERSDSFEKCYREVSGLLTALASAEQGES